MKIYMARHGETDWNLSRRIQGQTDTPLNQTGIEQAEELAQKLYEQKLPIGKIYASGHKRALTTAEIVGEKLKLPVIVKMGLEEISFGAWEGYTWKQVKELFPEEYGIWHEGRRYKVPPEGESYQQLLERVVPALVSIINEEENGVLLVTHSAVIMTLMSYIYEKPFEDMAKNYKTKNAEIVELSDHEIIPL